MSEFQQMYCISREDHFFGRRSQFEIVQKFQRVNLTAPRTVGAEKATLNPQIQYQLAVLSARPIGIRFLLPRAPR